MTTDQILTRFLEESGGHVVLDTDFRVVDAGPEYLRLTASKKDDILGKVYVNTITEPDPQRHAIVVERAQASLSAALKTKEPQKLPIIRSDIVVKDGAHQRVEERWWRPTHIPVLDEHGVVRYLVIRIEEKTLEVTTAEKIKAQRRSNYVLYLMTVLLVGVIALSFSRISTVNKETCTVQNNALEAQRHLANIMGDINTLLFQPPAPGQPQPTPRVLQIVSGMKSDLRTYLIITAHLPTDKNC